MYITFYDDSQAQRTSSANPSLLSQIRNYLLCKGSGNSALWGPIRCFVKDVFLHIPGFQPLLENGSIHGDVSQKPIMRNSVETGLDIAL